MARATKIDPWTAMAERLRAEACDSRPEFSAELHARICDVVRQCGTLHARRRRVLSRSLGWAGVAVAAALLVAAVVVGRSRPLEPSGGASKLSNSAALPPARPAPSTESATWESGLELVTDLADHAMDQFDSLVDAADAAGRWPSLDHDGRLALESLGERLPINLVPMSSSEMSDTTESSANPQGSAED
jgi:hypothetical protein